MTIENGWQPIETIPQTLDKYPVLSRYGNQLYLIEGIHAFNEPSSVGTHFFAFWYDIRPFPEIKKD